MYRFIFINGIVFSYHLSENDTSYDSCLNSGLFKMKPLIGKPCSILVLRHNLHKRYITFGIQRTKNIVRITCGTLFATRSCVKIRLSALDTKYTILIKNTILTYYKLCTLIALYYQSKPVPSLHIDSIFNYFLYL